MMLSSLSARDRQLVEAGLWPIDCDPARPLNGIEEEKLIAHHRREGISTPDLSQYRPMAFRGYLVYERRR